jgi:hypothetical protein
MAGLAAILVPSSLKAQITFQRTYGGVYDDVGFSVQQTTDGGYVIAGTTWHSELYNCDAYLIKTDIHGDTQWTRTFGGAGNDEAYSVRQTTDGGYVLAGYIDSLAAGGKNVYLVKTNSQGNTTWTRTFGGTGEDLGRSVWQTGDGGYVTTGTMQLYGTGHLKVCLIKTDANGESLWTRIYGNTLDNEGFSVEQTNDGGYVVTGYVWPDTGPESEVFLAKTDSIGDTLWMRTFGRLGAGFSVQQTDDRGYVIAGFFYGANHNHDICLVRTDSNGDTLWTKAYGGTAYDEATSVQQTDDGGFVITGATNSFGSGELDVYVIKTNAVGDTLWTRRYGDGEGYSVQQTADGGFIVCGYKYGANEDVCLIKTDSLGNVAVAEPKASPTRTPELSISCEPSPCRGATTIRVSPRASRFSPLSLRMCDSQGRLVRTFTVNRTSCTVWDGTDDTGRALPSGTYFVMLDADCLHAAARLVLQR